jgi:hypothetical protein
MRPMTLIVSLCGMFKIRLCKLVVGFEDTSQSYNLRIEFPGLPHDETLGNAQHHTGWSSMLREPFVVIDRQLPTGSDGCSCCRPQRDDEY